MTIWCRHLSGGLVGFVGVEVCWGWVFLQGTVSTAGPTGIWSGANWPVLGAVAAPNPEAASVLVPVPGAVRARGPGKGTFGVLPDK